VLVDVSIDQGGCFETSRPTTHSEPTYEVDGITHYCVTNMPGAVPITSTYALTNATLPYVTELAELGVEEALEQNEALRRGLNVQAGEITHPAVADALDRSGIGQQAGRV
jgi:alanine dehydrogenase